MLAVSGAFVRHSTALSAFRAAAAPVGGFPLLAVLVYVADKHPAVYAGYRDAPGRRVASIVSS